MRVAQQSESLIGIIVACSYNSRPQQCGMSVAGSVVGGGSPLDQLSRGLHAAEPRNVVSRSAEVHKSSFRFYRMVGVLRRESSVIDPPCTRTIVHFSSLPSSSFASLFLLLSFSSSSSSPDGQNR